VDVGVIPAVSTHPMCGEAVGNGRWPVPRSPGGPTNPGDTTRRDGRRPVAYPDPHERVRELRAMDRLLSEGEVAERSGMKIDRVWARARAGRIPHVRPGRYRRFRESAVAAWVQELETGGGARPTTRSNAVPLRRRRASP